MIVVLAIFIIFFSAITIQEKMQENELANQNKDFEGGFFVQSLLKTEVDNLESQKTELWQLMVQEEYLYLTNDLQVNQLRDLLYEHIFRITRETFGEFSCPDITINGRYIQVSRDCVTTGQDKLFESETKIPYYYSTNPTTILMELKITK